MTVAALIKLLKKEDQRAQVLLADHDHGIAEGEYNGYARVVGELPEVNEDPYYDCFRHGLTPNKNHVFIQV